MRLIDADALIKDFKWRCQGNCKNCYNSTFLATDEHCGLIDEQPTVEAKPVVHGEWIHSFGYEWKCSACGDVICTEGSWDKPKANFCEECGADMRGEKHD